MKKEITEELLNAAIDNMKKSNKEQKEFFMLLPCEKHARFPDVKIDRPEECILCLKRQP